jgi:hypothetical protein
MSGTRWLARLAYVVGFAAALALFAYGARDLDRLRHGASSAIDLLPLWLGGHVLAGGGDPTDATQLEAAYRALHPPVKAAGFLSYYPPTASVLAQPLSAVPFQTAALATRLAGAIGLIVSAALVACARPVRSRPLALIATIAVAGLFLATRAARASLPSGQVGPIVVFFTALTLWAFGRERHRLAGVALGIGAGLKLFPLVLLPAARPRVWVAAAVTLVALGLGVLAFAPDFDPVLWVSRLGGFVNQGVHPVWVRQEPWWVLRLWQARFLALGLPSLLTVVIVWRRRSDPEIATSSMALFAAWGGTIMAGSHHYHEGLVLLPALGWALAWPAQRGPGMLSALTTAALAGLAWWVGLTSPYVGANSLNGMVMGYGTWLVCAVRLGVAARR